MTMLRQLRFEPDSATSDCFALARIMSPEEVREAVRDRPAEERKALAGRWMVCGDVTAPAFDRMTTRRASELPWRISGLTSTEGVHYGVLTHQLDDYQHRFILPAWSALVCNFIRAVGTGEGYGFMFGRDGGEAAYVVLGRAPRERFGALREHFIPADQDALQRGITELPWALATLGRLDAIPSIVQGKDVRNVSVSVALPPPNALNGVEQVH